MISWSASEVAAAAGAHLRAEAAGGPTEVVIDNRLVEPGDLFVGLVGEHLDGGRFAQAALDAGAWGVLVRPSHDPSGGAVRSPRRWQLRARATWS